MRLKTLFSSIYSMLLVFILASFSFADDVAPKGPVAFFPEPRYAFEETLEGKELLHDFVIMNKGDSTLEVKKVNPG